MTYDVVINRCYGGFSLSRDAVLLARQLSGNPKWGGPTIAGDVYDNGEVCDRDFGFLDDIPRHDPILVEVVKQLGEAANGLCSELYVVKLEGNRYRIEDYDGMESVYEPSDEYYITI